MLHRFQVDISDIALPERFTWPFHYEPHRLSCLAAEEVQRYLQSRVEWQEEIAQGKMFGVLVVRDGAGDLGFLAAFSGNLGGENIHDYFVPPIYDMLKPGDFFRRGEAEISAINRTIADYCSSEEYVTARQALDDVKSASERELAELKRLHKERKEARDVRRKKREAESVLIAESQRDNADMQRLKRAVREKVAVQQQLFDTQQQHLSELKMLRQQLSASLQTQLFEQFRILNARGEVKNLCELFASTPQGAPPAGAGECAAPKLLQYAYLHHLEPIAMAEFWQGASPRGEVRHHGSFYPACNSKCKPILMHMLEGLDVEDNPLTMIAPPEPEVLWEDEWLVAINKPCGMLSVDGKSGVRSVEAWAHERYPEATGPIIIHRLDQSTSGILLLAKDKDTHKAIQEQFITRRVEKQYTALLDGEVDTLIGEIDLSIKLDYENRPRQMVSADGKRAITEYRVVAVEDGRTRVHFYPTTGRTHQLRLHSAHRHGLNAPIVGDNIYGRECYTDGDSSHRLCLHASMLEFVHPHTGKNVKIVSPAEF